MLKPRAFSVLALSTLALACGSKSSGTTGTTDAGDAALSSEQSAVFSTGSASLATNQQLAELADDLFDFDPTIDPKNTPNQNANAIGKNAQSNLGKCGKVTVSGAGVTVDFGAPPGCTLTNGDSVSGSVTVALTHSGGTTTLDLTLTDVVFDSVPLSGTASFATTTGSSFTVKTSLTSSESSDSADLTVTGASGSFSISGTATVTMASSTTAITFNGVTVAKGECYATAGTMGVDGGGFDETITFDSSTPETGKVSLAIGKLTTTYTLPAYGSCPSGA
jgi:hypothetical protein